MTIGSHLADIKETPGYVGSSLVLFTHNENGCIFKYLVVEDDIVHKHRMFMAYDIMTGSGEFTDCIVTNTQNLYHPPITTDGTPYARITEKTIGKSMQIVGFKMDCPTGSITKHYVEFDEDVELSGGYATAENSSYDTNLNMRVVDKYNVLGMGSDTPLNTFAKDVPVKKLELDGCEAMSTTSTPISKLFPFQIEVDNQLGSQDCQVYGTFKIHH